MGSAHRVFSFLERLAPTLRARSTNGRRQHIAIRKTCHREAIQLAAFGILGSLPSSQSPQMLGGLPPTLTLQRVGCGARTLVKGSASNVGTSRVTITSTVNYVADLLETSCRVTIGDALADRHPSRSDFELSRARY